MVRTHLESLSTGPPAANHLCAQCSTFRDSILPTARLERVRLSGFNFDETDRQNRRLIPHHPTLKAFHGAAHHGCHLCSLVWRYAALQDFQNAEEWNKSYKLTYTMSPHGKPDDGNFKVEIEDAQGQTMKRNTSGSVNLWLVPETNRSSWIPTRPSESLQAPTTASEASFHVARGWLGNCLKDHKRCALADEKIRNQPSRLLRVQRQGSDITVRLINKSAYPNGTLEYLTLSHCWGKGATVLLKQENIKSFQEEIDFEKLPATFTDAILTTIELGYQFLWIDSLCIIQDSLEDWAKESIIMSDIYRHCVCMIAAVAASSDDGGCFASRPPLGFMGFEMQDGDDTLHLMAPSSSNYGGSFVNISTFKTPLETRAWHVKWQI